LATPFAEEKKTIWISCVCIGGCPAENLCDLISPLVQTSTKEKKILFSLCQTERLSRRFTVKKNLDGRSRKMFHLSSVFVVVVVVVVKCIGVSEGGSGWLTHPSQQKK
jgi:hypothetical protein